MGATSQQVVTKLEVIMLRPDVKPLNVNFSSGPCSKRSNWKFQNLKHAILGRSHRADVAKNKLQKLIKLTKEILKLPSDYLVGIVPGSDTGAVEMAMWNALGPKNVSILVWESFGKDWQKDLTEQLKITQIKIVSKIMVSCQIYHQLILMMTLYLIGMVQLLVFVFQIQMDRC